MMRVMSVRGIHDIHDGGFGHVLFWELPSLGVFTIQIQACSNAGWGGVLGIMLSILSCNPFLDSLHGSGMLFVFEKLFKNETQEGATIEEKERYNSAKIALRLQSVTTMV